VPPDPWHQRVVPDQAEVDPVVVEQGLGLVRLALVQLDPYGRVRGGELGQRRHDRVPQRAGVPGDAQQPVRLVPGGQLELGRGDGGEDALAVRGQPAAGRGEPHPPALGLQQPGTDLPLQRGQLLADRGRAVPGGGRDGGHRAEPGQLHQGA